MRVLCEDIHFATGIVRYDANELKRIAGCRDTEIEETLGYTTGAVVIHRDDMAIV